MSYLTNRQFSSPTNGALSIDQLIHHVFEYFQEAPQATYKLIIGTDSKRYVNEALFVSVIILHRVGKGGRYFWTRSQEHTGVSLKRRILNEAFHSINLAKEFLEILHQKISEHHLSKVHIEIHVDVGLNGPTKEMIKEVVGMIEANGFKAFIKPASFGASFLADRYT